MVRNDAHDCVFVCECHESADHFVGRLIRVFQTVKASFHDFWRCTADGIRRAHEEVVGIVRSVGFRHQDVPIVVTSEHLGDIGDATVMEIAQFDVGFVVNETECVARGVLEEVAYLFVDLIRDFGRIRIPASRPDLGEEQFKVVGVRSESDEFARDVAFHALAVNIERFELPIGPFANAEVGERLCGVFARGNQHSVIAMIAGRVYQDVPILRRPFLSPV